jgi:hypothetical protein
MGGFDIAFVTVIARVSLTEQFACQSFSLQTCERKQPWERTVVSWLKTCSQMTVDPITKKVYLDSVTHSIVPGLSARWQLPI